MALRYAMKWIEKRSRSEVPGAFKAKSLMNKETSS
jgi:hypothetical protein